MPVGALSNEEEELITQYRRIPEDDPKTVRRFLNALEPTLRAMRAKL